VSEQDGFEETQSSCQKRYGLAPGSATDFRSIRSLISVPMLKLFRQYYPIRNIFFILTESIAISGSVVLADWLMNGFAVLVRDGFYSIKVLLIGVVLQTCLYYHDLYDFKIALGFKELGLRLIQALGVAAVILAGIYFAYPKAIIGHGIFEVGVAILIALIASWRYLYAYILRRGIFNEKILILGSGDLSQSIVKEIQDKIDCGYSIALAVCEEMNTGCFNGIVSMMPDPDGRYDMIGKARALGISKIIVALAEKRGRMPIRELLNCRLEGIEVIDGNTFYEMLTGRLIVRNLNPAWLIFSEGFQKSKIQRAVKRASDLLLSVILLILMAPFLAAVTVLIKIDSRGPALFYQERVGRGRRVYKIFKFRSMVADAEIHTGAVWAGEDDPRITRVGRIIRKLRIDELPQIWNVLKGEMSFVGPRPEREVFVNELEKQIPYYSTRLTVQPGITGWAQINYPYGASVEDAIEKLNYDLFYIKNVSFLMDLMIVLRTIKTVLFSKGAR
jgi:sugar transferase (PEP-CTERM system associated)